MSDELFIQPGLQIPASELDYAVSRSSGPGGQHANKTSTRVTVIWNVSTSSVLSDWQRARLLEKLATRLTSEGVLQIDSDDTRSQHQNRELVRARLAELVQGALKLKKRRVATRPSRKARERRVNEKKARATIKKNRRSPKDPDS
ncbi:MAG: aminoacyl-tRNA hydrolase [Bradymonadaceae bacterium]|nr:aminoacyl-tRNA hydrolase [Lujinxingiaceae bacterium]